MNESAGPAKRGRGWYWLFVVQFVGTLFPQFYASSNPTLFGFPFFYWYQMLWVIIGAILMGAVYAAHRRLER